MGALDNAVQILNNPLWKQYMAAASAYVARQVYTEATNTQDYAIRRRLVLDVLVNPNILADRLATLLGTDPDLVTTTSDPVTVDEQAIVQKVTGYWTALAKSTYPEDGAP